jgi:hypothetical protein
MRESRGRETDRPSCEAAAFSPRQTPARTIYERSSRCCGIITGTRMRFENFIFGEITIDGWRHAHDVVIDRGEVRKRKKKASKPFREQFGHTPLSVEENIPWKCRHLIIGTGAHGQLPVMDEVKIEAARRKVELVMLPTVEAIQELEKNPKATNAILHVTC